MGVIFYVFCETDCVGKASSVAFFFSYLLLFCLMMAKRMTEI